MLSIKDVANKYLINLKYFFKYLKYRILLALAMSLLVGVLDGLGLTMFLPLLQMAGGESVVDNEEGGAFSVLVNLFESFDVMMTLEAVLILMLIFFCLKGLFVFFDSYFKATLLKRFINSLRNDLLQSLNTVSFKYFVRTDIGRVQNTLNAEIDRVAAGFNHYFSALQFLILLFVYLFFAFLVNSQFAFFVIIGGVLTNFFYQIIYRKTKQASNLFSVNANSFQGKIIEHIFNFKYLKATGKANFFSNRVSDSIGEMEASRLKIGFLNSILQGIREPLLVLVVVIIIIVQVNFLNSSLAGILISLLFFYRALTVFTQMQNSWNSFLSISGSLRNVQDFHLMLSINYQANGSDDIDSFNSHLSTIDGTFMYDSKEVLSNISITINKNEIIAFVGESGSGKTTLVNILAGLLPLDSGEFLIDEVDSKSINLSSYQKRIGYITQEPVVFNDTIFNNVTFWAEPNDATKVRFFEALKNASLIDFVNELPDKEQTVLGNNGINISGGQKQRISIARELFKNIDILILDEATSALDSETERSIQENIELLRGNYTILIVAHRLSTIKKADKIVYMNKGKIKDIGTFEELKIRQASFQNLAKLQGA